MSNKKQNLLSKSGRIGSCKLKNRIIMAPMGTNYGTTDGLSTERDIQYYGERANGQVAMIITEAMNISPEARNHTNSLCIYDDMFIPGLAAIVKKIHKYDSYAVAQLNHRGQLLRSSVLGMQPVGPTNGIHPATGEPVRGLNQDEIKDIQANFVQAAIRAKRAGYDGVEIHAANGYLFHQFFTPRFNNREDKYGGSLENRMRFLMETVEKIKYICLDFNILVRISASEFISGGYSLEDAIHLAKSLEKLEVAAIDLSGGSNEHPSLSRYCIQPPSFPRNCLEPLSKKFKAAINIPVIVAGRIIEPKDGEAILKNQSADFISVGRALIADPHWAAKAIGQVTAPIRTCISCNICYERLSLEKDVSCAVNPLVGTEFEKLPYLEPQLFNQPKVNSELKVLVIGGGVAGFEAARISASLGYETEIWEKKEVIGGQIDLALSAPDKEDVKGVWEYREASVAARYVSVKTGFAVNQEKIFNFNPDFIFLATGSSPKTLPNAKNWDVNVFEAWSVLRNPDLIPNGSRVTIIGGGLVGIETLDFLADKNVSGIVVELRSQIAPEMARNNRFEILERLQNNKFDLLTNAKIQNIENGIITLSTKGRAKSYPIGDAIITAIGVIPNRTMENIIIDTGIPYKLIGDCNIPGDFMSAIRDASLSAFASLRGISKIANTVLA